MTPATLEWLTQKVPEFAQLSVDEIDAIADFSFLWSLFEGTKNNGRCDVSRIKDYVAEMAQESQLEVFDCEPYLEYLKKRYSRDGKVTDHFSYLYIERSCNPTEVMQALSNEDAAKETKIIGCLIIVYRLRNNLFHGEKWKYNLQGQLENFSQANEFLKYLMK